MRLGRDDVFIEDMHIIKGHIQQWIRLIYFDIEIVIEEIIEMELLRLIVFGIHVQEECIQSGVTLGINFISNLERVSAYNWSFPWQNDLMSNIVLIRNAKVNAHAVKSRNADIFKCNSKLQLVSDIQAILH